MANLPQTIAPASASPLVKLIDRLAARQLDAIPVNRIFNQWSPNDCPAHLLGHLAWAVSVEEWDSAWPEETKRTVIRTSADVHRHKGTAYAVREALVAMGYNNVTLNEYRKFWVGTTKTLDGSWNLDGSETLGGWQFERLDLAAHLFEVDIDTGSIPTQAEINEIIRRVNIYKNERSRLKGIRYASLFLDGTWNLDGGKILDGGMIYV